MDEAGLKLEDLTELGHARTYWETDPFGHGKGTDTFNIMYFARGKGKLRINNMHEEPMIVKPSDYPLIREQLHPYIQDFMDIAINLVK